MDNQQNNWQQQAWQQQPGSVQQQPQPQPQPQPVYYQEQPKKGKGWIVALVSVILIFLLLAIAMVSCTAAIGSSMTSSVFGGASSYDSLDYLSEDAIGIITLDGTIQYDGTTSSPEGLKAQLDKAEQNPHIKAVVLRVNSGGGTATAGEEMTEYIKNFTKPVVVSSASVNASAAYMISSQADYIYTAKTTAIGSIGTALQITDLSGLYEKLGISIENITSSDSKDSGYGTRSLTEEERKYYQDMVDQINDTFIEIVVDGRGMTTEEVTELATGMTFTGIDAVENGIADEIGTYDDACAKAAELAGISSYTTVGLTTESMDLSSLLGLLGYSSSVSEEDLVAALKELENDGTIAE